MALTWMQSIDRKQHTASTGIEIQRRFYFEPYSAFPEVVAALQGSVTRPVAGQPWKRTLPARDPYIENCFCNEARVEFADPDVIATSIDLRGDEPPLLLWSEVQKLLEKHGEDPIPGAAGGVVTASYRPLFTVLLGEDGKPSTSSAAFDWMDPEFVPAFKQVVWPEGLIVPVGGDRAVSIPKDLAEPISVPVIDFSIRRILVGEPPWDAIDAIAGSVNREAWPDPADSYNLPQFEPETLKYVGAQILNRFDSAGNRWYEVVHNFSWISLHDGPVFDRNGNESGGLNPVTWNHVLMRPWWILALEQPKTGWYYVLREEAQFVLGVRIKIFRFDVGALHHLTDFDPLFRL